MAENRCPMCGKMNPPELEVCQYCEARLKPLIAPPPSGGEPHGYEEPPRMGEPEPAAPDAAAQDDAAPNAEADDAGSDWLSDLRAGSGDEEQEPEQQEGGPAEAEEGAAEDLDDWLQRLQAEETREELPQEEAPEEDLPQGEGEDELLSRLTGLEGDEALPSAAVEEPEPEELTELPPWPPRAEDIQAETAPPDLAAEPEPEPELEEEEEFETLEFPELSLESGEPSPEDAGPDWLQEVPEDLPDELLPETPQDEALEPAEEAIPEWLQSADLEMPEEPEQVAEEDEAAVELPEWLKTGGLDSDLPAYDVEDEELPAWLQTGGLEALGADLTAEPEIPESTQEPAGEEPPDWLEDFSQEGLEEESFETRPLPDLPSEEENAGEPDWLADIERPKAEGEPPEEGQPAWMPGETGGEPALSLEAEQVPDWLRNLEAVQAEAASGSEEAVLEDDLAGLVSPEDEQTPEWLAELQAKTPEIPAEAAGPPPEPPAETPAAPRTEPEPEPEAEPEAEPAAEGELPQWITEISEEARAIEARDLEDVAGELELTPAELPGWLKAMRPVEAVAPISPRPDRGEDEPETAGPLAGLQGVVPVEPEITQAGRPPVFSAKVELTDTQQRHVNLLKELVAGEEDVQPRVQPGVLQPQRVLRWAIALGLILAVLWPLVTGGVSGLPFLFPPETLAFRQAVTMISDQSPVLVAFDYQPAMAGEMEAAASPALDHLMIRNARLSLVSTSPTGPALAERLLSQPRGVGGHEYRNGENYVNLGYIPGQAAGLQNFAINPRATLPQAFNQQGLSESVEVWDTPPLQGVQALTDFALVVVVVDNADTARAWVEQVQPRLGEVPLLMVVSAQTEPMVRPYYEAVPRQIQGMVTGLAGGTPYEQANSQISGRSQLARGYWSPFSNGLLMAELLILIGGAYNLFVSLFGRQPQATIEEQA